MQKDGAASSNVDGSAFDYYVCSVAYNVFNQIIAQKKDLLYTYNIGRRMLLG